MGPGIRERKRHREAGLPFPAVRRQRPKGARMHLHEPPGGPAVLRQNREAGPGGGQRLKEGSARVVKTPATGWQGAGRPDGGKPSRTVQKGGARPAGLGAGNKQRRRGRCYELKGVWRHLEGGSPGAHPGRGQPGGQRGRQPPDPPGRKTVVPLRQGARGQAVRASGQGPTREGDTAASSALGGEEKRYSSRRNGNEFGKRFTIRWSGRARQKPSAPT